MPSTGGAEEGLRPFVLVSDIDDTLKITDVKSKIDTVYNGLFSSRVFLGMPEVYTVLLKSSKRHGQPFPRQTGPLVFLSGAPTFIQGILESQLEPLKLPKATYFLRDWFAGQTVGEFKKEILEDLQKTSDLPFLFFGDDTEKDPEVLSDFSVAHPEHSVRVYIHAVTGRELPLGVIRYHTAFEIAVREFEEGRLGVEDVTRVGLRVMNKKRVEDLFPDFSVCPLDYRLPDSPLSDRDVNLKVLKDQVTEYIQRLCAASR
jgi:phosphatidate phosphatase APP1